MANKKNIHFPTDNRIKFIIGAFLVIVAIIVLRLIWLQVIDVEENKKAAIESRTITHTINPKRGTIYDRNGNILAYSKDAKTIYANPSEIDDQDLTANKLTQVLGGTQSDYKKLIEDKNKKFVYIKRRVENNVSDNLKDQNIKGIYFLEDTKREYPYGQVAGQIVGSCNIDGDGLCGLELQYDDVLRGSKGTVIIQQGQNGMPIPGGKVQETRSIEGQDLIISIDIELQQKVEEYTEAYGREIGGKSCHSVIMDPTNGEIYAACSTPYMNPADMTNVKEGATELRQVSGAFEPGSTFKTISASAILEDKAVQPDTVIDCPSSIKADGYDVSDAHKRADAKFTFKEIIAKSSNVGIALATERLGFDKFYDKILKYQFDQNSGIDYPGDHAGDIKPQSEWSKIQSYNISFGQGLTVSPMQMLKFYGAIINNGVEVTPHFLMKYLQSDKDVEYPTYEVIENKETIDTLLDLLRGVVENGTGTYAKIPGYGVAGKTGTGEIADEKGSYLKGIYFNSFIGFLTKASQPLTCYVGSDQVHSEVSMCPLYKEIMEFAIEKFKIAPKD